MYPGWVMVGGSYAGALAAWTATLFSGTFWAYYASSATVHNLVDFWQHWTPIQENMPQDCRGVATTLIDYINNILTYGTEQNVTHLKARLGFPAKICNDDFMDALADGPIAGAKGAFTACSWPVEDWVTGSPPGIPTIVSRYITADYKRKDCDSLFPTGPNGQTYDIAKGLTPDIVNDYTGDWTTVNTSRLIYVKGEADTGPVDH
ncbi:hypothetical protein TI39_contig311g00028 [Zymoseptoria brevis]|uniref:Uncharacterized protein n=1 Tax=Zymoseptoria brevis TaxID=1047168 RepID=A0A0F4GUC1_9PEZI|nr:hypothetical protein TI39_contig311g00028 [Zymoseptoria brevis]